MEWDLITNLSSAMTGVGETTALVVKNNFAFITYTDSEQRAIVAKKDLSTGTWETPVVIATGVLNDAHNGSSIGVDPSGYVHICWDIHSSPTLNYAKSLTPYSIQDLSPAVIGGAQPSNVSYARFYNAGPELYFLCRVGYSGNGNEWIKRWTPQGWVDIAIPLIDGSGSSPISNPYLGCCLGQSNGRLHVVWTHRVGYYNQGVYYACYDSLTNLWTKASGYSYTLPIKLESIQSDSITDPTNATISNNGLGVVLDSQARPCVVFSQHVSGAPEVFFARYENGWVIRQLTNLHLPRLRACPTGPLDGPPRPCDYELQGPFITYTNGTFHIFYSRSVGPAGPFWQRPPAILYESISTDGKEWKTREIKQNVGSLFGEVIRESTGLPIYLLQEVSYPIGRLWLWTPEEVSIPTPIAKISATLPIAGSQYLELDDSDSWSSPQWTISTWIVPEPVPSTMGIIDKGGPLGSREFRVLLWGNAPPFVYDSTRIQVLMGGSTAWSFMWHPQVEILPGMLTHLVVTWNGAELRAYKNGILTVSTDCSISLIPNAGSKVLVGANRDGSGNPERFYQGKLALEMYNVALNEQAVARLYDCGEK